MKRISKRLAASGALDVVATAVPGMKDILVLGKVKSLDESRAADLIIVDAPAAGHAITFLLSARGLLDAVRVGPIRKQAQDVVGAALRSRAVPGDARDAPRGDAGERGGRHRVRDRGPRRRGPRPGRRQPLLRTAARRVSPPRRRDPRRRRGVRPLRLATRGRRPRATRPRSVAERHAVQHEQIERLRERLPLPQIELPFLFTPDITRSRLDVARGRVRTRDRAAVTYRDRSARRRAARSSSAAAPAGSARRRSPRCSRSKAHARAATRAWSRSIPQAARRRARPRAPHERPDRDRPEALVRIGDDDGSARARRAALGDDARHEVDVRPARHPQRVDARTGAADPRQPLLPQRLRRARRHAGVHGDGEAPRAARRRRASTSSSSTRRRRATRSTSSTRPQRLHRLLDNRIFRMLMMPTRGVPAGRERRGADVPAHRRARRRLGGRSTTSSRSSGRSKGWRKASATAAQVVGALLADPETAFVLVTSPRRDAMEEATFFAARLAEPASRWRR